VLHAEIMALFPQMGTEFCTKTDDPQTGKAVEGFCPSSVHSCALPCKTNRVSMRYKKKCKHLLKKKILKELIVCRCTAN